MPAAQAQSQVTIYGIAAVEMVHVTGVAPVAGAAAAGTVTRLDNSQVTSSRLGFKGVEDLGGGLGAIYGLESGIGLDAGTAGSGTTMWSRGSYVGLTDASIGHPDPGSSMEHERRHHGQLFRLRWVFGLPLP